VHAAAPEDVIGDDEAALSYTIEDEIVIERVIRLVGINEIEVDRTFVLGSLDI